jgi:phosphoribosylglycinamide formyltransferase 1
MSGARRRAPTKRLAVLISGRGTNLQALLDAQAAGVLGGEIALVISNRAEAAGLHRAEKAAVPAVVVPSVGLDRAEHEARLREHLDPLGLDLLCLAGYMRLLSPEFVRGLHAPILNVHPSLLPAFPGLDATRQALEHGVKVTGATVHFVDEGLDSGPIVAQEPVLVADDDTPETLAARVLDVEHRLYPAAVRRVLGGAYRLDGGRVRWEKPS